MAESEKRSPYLSREEMEAVLDAGGAVLHQGVHITRKEHLPTKAELAGGDAERLAEAREDYLRRLAALQAEGAQFNDQQLGNKAPPEGATASSASGAVKPVHVGRKQLEQ